MNNAFKKSLLNGNVPPLLGGFREQIVIPNVPSPEDPSKLRDVAIEVITVDQVFTAEEVDNMAPNIHNDIEYILRQKLFGNEDIRTNVDANIILGIMSKEEADIAPKLLLFWSSSMLANLIQNQESKNETATNIYSTLRLCAGKRGFEIRRFGGSSGKITPQSDMNLLAVMKEHEGSLPRQLSGSVIIHDEDK